jgi:hypothetical protein
VKYDAPGVPGWQKLAMAGLTALAYTSATASAANSYAGTSENRWANRQRVGSLVAYEQFVSKRYSATRQAGNYVYLLHQAAFGTGEHLALSRFLADAGEVRQGVVVNTPNREPQLEANRQAFALDFVGRPQFLAAYPTTLTPAQFVDVLNANTGGSLSQAERDARVAELAADNTATGRAAVLLKVVGDADFRAREKNRAFVLMEYFGYLRRAPDEAPDGNFDGYNFWLDKLNQFDGNFVEAELVKAFITSAEYRQRFGP